MSSLNVNISGSLSLRILAMCTSILMLAGMATAGGGKETVLYTFQGGTDGADPTGRLVADSAGNFYGTTALGGAAGFGTVFELVHEGGVWKEKVLYTFQGGSNDGACPAGGLIFDKAGNLYGTTGQGSRVAFCLGTAIPTVFQLTLKGGAWTETVLYKFPQASYPNGDLIFDGKGDLYGTTYSGGTHGEGTVFRLTPNSKGSWTEGDLYSFTGLKGGAFPTAGVVFGKQGILYGTTSDGAGTAGTVFSLTPPGGSRRSWHHQVLYRFSGNADSGAPDTPLILRSGKLYGANAGFGSGNGALGTVFELTPPAKKGGLWSETTLYDFTSSGGKDGIEPLGLLMDHAGNMFGATFWGGNNIWCGGTSSSGVVFEVSPHGTKWTEQVLYAFTDKLDGCHPTGGVIFGKDGALYGVTGGGDGESNPGTVYRVAH